jgi:hypothetical protein
MGISTGAYAIIFSWVQGSQYTQEVGLRSHQTNSNLNSQVSSYKTPGEGPRPKELALSRKREWLFPVGSRTAGWLNLNETRRKRIEKSDSSLPASRSKGGQETFRRDALARVETPRKSYFYFRKEEKYRDYYEHPYWFGVGSTKSHL